MDDEGSCLSADGGSHYKANLRLHKNKKMIEMNKYSVIHLDTERKLEYTPGAQGGYIYFMEGVNEKMQTFERIYDQTYGLIYNGDHHTSTSNVIYFFFRGIKFRVILAKNLYSYYNIRKFPLSLPYFPPPALINNLSFWVRRLLEGGDY